MQTTVQILILVVSILNVVGNALPATSRTGRALRAIVLVVRALWAAIRDTPVPGEGEK